MKNLAVISPLVVMMFVSSITPGPNNLMLMLAGTRFGFARTLPHLLGVSVGATLVICLTFLGFGALMLGHPRLVDGMTVACGVYLAWMATQLLKAAPLPQAAQPPAEPQNAGRPMRAREAVAFQFINPKLWTMAVAATSIAARFPFSPRTSVVVVALITLVVNTPCVALWAACGKMLRRRLDDERARRIFDVSMALLVAGTALWIVWPVFCAPPA
jgi:threonine/homoserine/homoserine lactone efflux protein